MPQRESAKVFPGHKPLIPAHSVLLQALLDMKTWFLGTALWLQCLHFGCRPSFIIGLASVASAPAWGQGCQWQLLPLPPGLQMAPPVLNSSSSNSSFLPPILPNHLYCTTFRRCYSGTTRSSAHPATLLAFPILDLGSKRYSMSNTVLRYMPHEKKVVKSSKCIPTHSSNAVFSQTEGDFNLPPRSVSLPGHPRLCMGLANSICSLSKCDILGWILQA